MQADERQQILPLCLNPRGDLNLQSTSGYNKFDMSRMIEARGDSVGGDNLIKPERHTLTLSISVSNTRGNWFFFFHVVTVYPLYYPVV